VITHVVLFRWKPDTTPIQVDRIREALATLPGILPVIKTYRFGSDLGVSAATNMDFAVVATFDSIEDWKTYDTDADHESVRDVIRPAVLDRAAVQFES